MKNYNTLFEFFDNTLITGRFEIEHIKDELYRLREELDNSENAPKGGLTLLIPCYSSGRYKHKQERAHYIDPREIDFLEYLNILAEKEIIKIYIGIEEIFFSILSSEKGYFLDAVSNKIDYLKSQLSNSDPEQSIIRFWIEKLQSRFMDRYDADFLTHGNDNQKKIKSCLSRIELSLLFSSLKEASLFDGSVSQKKIANLLENNFLCTKSKQFKTLDSIDVLMTQIRPDGDYPVQEEDILKVKDMLEKSSSYLDSF